MLFGLQVMMWSGYIPWPFLQTGLSVSAYVSLISAVQTLAALHYTRRTMAVSSVVGDVFFCLLFLCFFIESLTSHQSSSPLFFLQQGITKARSGNVITAPCSIKENRLKAISLSFLVESFLIVESSTLEQPMVLLIRRHTSGQHQRRQLQVSTALLCTNICSTVSIVLQTGWIVLSEAYSETAAKIDMQRKWTAWLSPVISQSQTFTRLVNDLLHVIFRNSLP